MPSSPFVYNELLFCVQDIERADRWAGVFPSLNFDPTVSFWLLGNDLVAVSEIPSGNVEIA